MFEQVLSYAKLWSPAQGLAEEAETPPRGPWQGKCSFGNRTQLYVEDSNVPNEYDRTSTGLPSSSSLPSPELTSRHDAPTEPPHEHPPQEAFTSPIAAISFSILRDYIYERLHPDHSAVSRGMLRLTF